MLDESVINYLDGWFSKLEKLPVYEEREPNVWVPHRIHTIAGSRFCDLGKVIPSVGDKVSLKRNPNNRCDRNAIEIWWCGRMFGHVGRTPASQFAPLMDRRQALRGYIYNVWNHTGLASDWVVKVIYFGRVIETLDQQAQKKKVKSSLNKSSAK